MVVEETTKNKGGAGKRVGGKGTRSTSKKNKQQEDSSGSSDAETKAGASVAERTKRTLKEAELKATATFLKARDYQAGQQPDESNYTTIYDVTTRRELGLLTRAQIADEILTRESKKVPRLQGSKISLLLTEIEIYLHVRGEFK